MPDEQDVMKRTYASLRSLRSNLPNHHPDNKVDEATADLYMKQLDKLSSIGIDVEEFKIPQTMLTMEMAEINYQTHETAPTGNINLKLGYLKIKLDSIITYFSLVSENDETVLGFHN